MKKTCYKCKYFDACGDYKRTAPCNGYVPEITESQAREFYRDLCEAVYDGDFTKKGGGIMSEERIAQKMGISVERAEEFLWTCAKYNITERQGGAWVV